MTALGPPGPGRTLAVAYAIFALAAGSRSAVQIASHFADAPVPYVLSALAAVIYVVAAATIGRPEPARQRIARIALMVELVGVIAVGIASLADAGGFDDETVWSEFGSGYLFLPLLLPVLGLIWLRRAESVGRARLP